MNQFFKPEQKGNEIGFKKQSRCCSTTDSHSALHHCSMIGEFENFNKNKNLHIISIANVFAEDDEDNVFKSVNSMLRWGNCNTQYNRKRSY
ncbi:hypothetical protein T07_10944 [Trichinella nelsoni]|uniref:Uncharacterized protein n=1 Tax=Trichinella nelsoni TaxID=6336 RepID=A0A0V0SDR8_9BILA|nr:hypothetical protein T07_10944 [Trichinella nelsoni]